MLVEFLDGGMQGESSNTGVVEDNLEASNAEQTYVFDPQVVQNMIEDGEAEENGPYMEADQGEEDERIVEQMEADDAEHLAFVDDCNTPVLCLHLGIANHTYHASSSIQILHA